MSDFHTGSRPVARKAHRCSDCNGMRILPGDSYRKLAGSEFGEFYTWKQCARCERIWKKIHRHDSFEGAEYGDAEDSLKYHLRERTKWRRAERAKAHPDFYCSTCGGKRTVVADGRYVPCHECEPAGACYKCHGLKVLRTAQRGDWIACLACKSDEFKAEMDRRNREGK